jgi:23S rRNA pseudouridine2605 synthase
MSLKVRLQKVLAEAGIASRRKCEEFIAAGRVTVDGRTVTELGFSIDPEKEEVRFDGRRLERERKVVLAVHKPRGYVSTSAQTYRGTLAPGEKRVIDLVGNRYGRLYTVGRLDAESEGLILLTNDGALTEHLTHPRHEVEKVYRIEVKGQILLPQLERLRAGVFILGRKAKPLWVSTVFKDRLRTVVEIGLHEGRNREVRRILRAIGLLVQRLTRVRIGPLGLEGLGKGRFRELSFEEVTRLRKSGKP